MKTNRPIRQLNFIVVLLLFFFIGLGLVYTGYNTSPLSMTDGGKMRTSNVYYLIGSALLLLAFIGIVALVKMKEKDNK
ncbi:hypothetical protein LX64_01031 [Chitinophaga skermanii]|uniref:Uncharacterized protein n=1 Tax=Chitinophaga skermanii TaxID=331697 RepID=A0A327QVM6_9BACT|nr:hypothetical protein [Chitinophaga skermanii]RAJ08381.1 hypothetical protein LX64_01031 [Chitinophaga skermanii]